MTIKEFDGRFKVGDEIKNTGADGSISGTVKIAEVKIGNAYFWVSCPKCGSVSLRKDKGWELVPKPSEKEKEDWSEGNKKIRRDLYAKMLSEFTKHPMDGYKIKLDESVQKQIDFEKTFSEYKKGISGEKEIKRLKAELAERDRVINDLCSLCQTYLRTRQRVN